MNDFFNRTLFQIAPNSSLKNVLIFMGAALAISLAICFVYIFTYRKNGYMSSLIVTILLIGPAVSIIVACIGNNIAGAISIGGGLALIRFRSTLEDPKALVYLFLSLASGMACGTGFIGLAVVCVGIVLIVLIIANLVGFDNFGGRIMKLTVIVPESLDFYGVFDSVLEKHCRFYHLDKVRTTDYGTLAELDYRIKLKDISRQKELIDDIRTMNGNLNVSIVQKATDF